MVASAARQSTGAGGAAGAGGGGGGAAVVVAWPPGPQLAAKRIAVRAIVAEPARMGAHIARRGRARRAPGWQPLTGGAPACDGYTLQAVRPLGEILRLLGRQDVPQVQVLEVAEPPRALAEELGALAEAAAAARLHEPARLVGEEVDVRPARVGQAERVAELVADGGADERAEHPHGAGDLLVAVLRRAAVAAVEHRHAGGVLGVDRRAAPVRPERI